MVFVCTASQKPEKPISEQVFLELFYLQLKLSLLSALFASFGKDL